VANALVSGYQNNLCKGFRKLDDSISYLEDEGHSSYRFLRSSFEDERAPEKGDPLYYAMANGQNVGIYECYEYTSPIIRASHRAISDSGLRRGEGQGRNHEVPAFVPQSV